MLSIIVVLMLNVVVGIIWLCIEGISLEDDHERLERREARRKDKKQRAKEWIIKEREQEKEWYPKIRD